MRRKLTRMSRSPVEDRGPSSPMEAAGGRAGYKSGGALGGGAEVEAVRLSELLDCPSLKGSSDIFSVAHVCGLDAEHGLLALMPGCIALLYGYELAAEDEGGFVRALPIATAKGQPSEQRARDGSSALQIDGGNAAGRLPTTSRRPPYRRIPNSHVTEVARRRYQLQPWALQLLLSNGETVLLSLAQGEASRDALYSRLVSIVPKSAAAEGANDPRTASASQSIAVAGGWPSLPFASEKSELTDAWQRGAITNFGYLMALNTLSGRCFDDLMQYPILPWVLREHSKAGVNLRSVLSFRDLGKPMGAQTDNRADQFRQRYLHWQTAVADEDSPPFHYGTHYSSAAAVSSFLIRLEPFSSYHCAMQDGRIDLADRLFHSVEEEWQLASGEKGGDTGCVKELVPELFYLWEALLNINGLDLGRRQDGTACAHVHLPRWARGSAWKLVRTLRQALESPHVSRELPGWIDLIFGCLQQGEGAAANLNVFLPCTYIGAVELSTLDAVHRAAILSQIQLVGQSPEQLWKERKHPPRSSAAALNTVPLTPLLVALAAGQTLVSAGEEGASSGMDGQPIHGLMVAMGGERASALGAHTAIVPRRPRRWLERGLSQHPLSPHHTCPRVLTT